MKIGEAGEAFFVFETDSDVPDDLITSPLLEPTLPVSPNPLPQEDFGRFGTRYRKDDPIEDGLGQEPDFLDLNAPSTLLSGDHSVDPRHDFNTGDYYDMGPLNAQRIYPLQDHTGLFLPSDCPTLLKICLDDSSQSQLKDRRTAVSTSNKSLTDACIHTASPSNEPIPFPSLHPPSALPPDPPHLNPVSLLRSSATSDEYSWEWGGFPQRSKIRMEYTVSDTAPVKTAHSTETDEQLVVSQLGEFQRSKSLPPEFELDATEGVASTSRKSNEQLSGPEMLSDVETGFDYDSSMLDRESKSWARWWRRDNRHPRRVDIRSERLPLQSAASEPSPGVSCFFFLSFL
jgi:phosphatidate phosphatase LPIN